MKTTGILSTTAASQQSIMGAGSSVSFTDQGSACHGSLAGMATSATVVLCNPTGFGYVPA